MLKVTRTSTGEMSATKTPAVHACLTLTFSPTWAYDSILCMQLVLLEEREIRVLPFK